MTKETFDKERELLTLSSLGIRYAKDTIFNVKIEYSSGRHLYANIFNMKMYLAGKKYGTITGIRRMNMIERFMYKNCR